MLGCCLVVQTILEALPRESRLSVMRIQSGVVRAAENDNTERLADTIAHAKIEHAIKVLGRLAPEGVQALPLLSSLNLYKTTYLSSLSTCDDTNEEAPHTPGSCQRYF